MPLGHSSWESYCRAEFGIGRAQAYRLLDVARALAAMHGAVTAGTETSRTRDTDPAAAAALDYGLSQCALIAVSSRSGDVAELPHWNDAQIQRCRDALISGHHLSYRSAAPFQLQHPGNGTASDR